MLRFFSKIRYKLAAENRVVKYTRYAIGEIVLVVFGILIALQINNWNEEQKREARMITNIKSICTEIKIDIENIHETIETLDEQEVAGRYTIPIMESKERIITDSLKFILNFNALTTTPIISERSNTWDFINSSGIVSEFPDPELLKMLQDYYNCFQEVVTNFNNSANPVRLELRKLKYELFSDSEHRKFFPNNSPRIPGIEVYNSIFKDYRILPLCRFIGSTAIFFEDEFKSLESKAWTISDFIDKKYN